MPDVETYCSGRKKRSPKEYELPQALPLELKFSILQDEVVDLISENSQVNSLLSFMEIHEGQTIGQSASIDSQK